MSEENEGSEGRHFLLCVDGSPSSDKAFHFILEKVYKEPDYFTLVHILQRPVGWLVLPGTERKKKNVFIEVYLKINK